MSSEQGGGGQYSEENLRLYEWIFGEDFLSSGAAEVAHEAARAFGLHDGSRVLDVGSGLGGSAFFFAQTYGAAVTGLDVLPHIIDEARKRAGAKRIATIEFLLGDIVTVRLPPRSFDAIYSKDAFLHIPDKRALLLRLFDLAVPGGCVFFSDYLRGVEHGAEAFEAYVSSSGYALAMPAHYTTLLSEVGFTEVLYEDTTARLIEIVHADIAKMRASTQNSPSHMSGNIQYLVERWELKLRCLLSGEMKWGTFTARRPS